MTGPREQGRMEEGRRIAVTEATPAANPATAGPLFPGEETERFRERWDTIQIRFVDEPRQAVDQAEKLVAEVMTTLEQTFAEERSRLGQTGDGDDARSTEDLRQALRRYRAFFDRLLTI